MVNYFYKHLLTRYIPRWMVLVFDMYIVMNTFLLAYFVRFNFTLSFDTAMLLPSIFLVLSISLLVFLAVGSYKNIIRHSGLKDAIDVTVASAFIFILLAGLMFLNRMTNLFVNFTIPISILVIHFLLNGFMLIASRFVIKKFYYLLKSGDHIKKSVLIFGAGESGMLTFDVLHNDLKSKSEAIGFIDDRSDKKGKRIKGVPVYPSKVIDAAFIENKKIKEIIISVQNLPAARLMEIVDALSLLPVEVKIVPSTSTWINGNFKQQEIKKVKIEDLLGRTQIVLNNPDLKKEFKNKVVLITGAAGSIGSEIARQISQLNCRQFILIDQAESDLYNLQQYFNNKDVENTTAIVADVRDEKRMDVLLQQYKPSIIFHAAAYKHVPFMEENPYEAVRINIAGTKIMADLAIKNKVKKFIMISTDKAVNPTNVMGATKRIAEMYINCLENNGTTKFITTRFGNVLGSNGSVIPLFNNQIKQGGPVMVTHKEITRYFMTIPEACQLVLEAGLLGKGGEIFVFDMGTPIKIYDLALKMIRLSGFKYPEEITIKITGLRPGEKIYEELLANGEHTKPTHHEKIMIAKVTAIDKAAVKNKITDLCNVNHQLHFEQTVSKMKEIVPEFISKNSTFEKLDK